MKRILSEQAAARDRFNTDFDRSWPDDEIGNAASLEACRAEVLSAARHLSEKREQCLQHESVLQKNVAALCDVYHGSLRDLAKELGITVQYLCDIRHARRKVSPQVVQKICDWKAV